MLWRRWVILVPLIVATVLIFGFYFRDSLSPTLLGCGDHWLYFGPMHFALDAALHGGELPLWNPLILCGTPYAANPQALLFYPPNLLRSLLTLSPTPLNTHLGLGLLIFAHIILAGVATYRLARAHQLSRGAALTAAFVFMFSANMTGRAMVQWLFVALVCWLPVLLLLVRRALAQRSWRGKLRAALLGGLVFGVSTLAGFPQLTLYLALTVGLYALLYRIVRMPRTGLGPALRRHAVRDFATLALLFAVGGLSAAAMLLPTAQFAPLSGRAKDGAFAQAEYDYFRYAPAENGGATSWMFRQTLRAKEIFKSSVLYSGGIVRENGEQEFRSLKLAGAGVLLLAVAALAHRRRRDVWLHGLLFLILLDCAIGPPFPAARLFQWLAPFRLGFSERVCIVACLPLAMLAGYGVDAAVRRTADSRTMLLRSGLLLLAGCAILLPLYAWTRPHAVLGDLSSWVLIAPAALLGGLVMAGRTWPPAFWRGLFPLLVFAELWAWNASYLPDIYRQLNYTGSMATFGETKTMATANARATYAGGGEHRADLESHAVNQLMYELTPVTNGYDPLHIGRARNVLSIHERDDAYTRLFYPFEVTLEHQRGNLFLKRSLWLARQWAAGPLPSPQALYPVTTTVFLPEGATDAVPRVDRDVLPATSLADPAPPESLPLPEAWQAPLPAAGNAGEQTFTLPAFEKDPRHAALILRCATTTAFGMDFRFTDPDTGRWEFGAHQEIQPGDGLTVEVPLPEFSRIETAVTLRLHGDSGVLRFESVAVRTDTADEDHLIRIGSRRFNSVTATVGPLEGARILVYVDAQYPGWRAYVDGERADILLANDAFKAVVLPAGTHEVRFVFRPRAVYAGMAVSLLTAVLVSFGVYGLRRQPRPNAS